MFSPKLTFFDVEIYQLSRFQNNAIPSVPSDKANKPSCGGAESRVTLRRAMIEIMHVPSYSPLNPERKSLYRSTS